MHMYLWYECANKIQLLAHKIDVQQHVIRGISTHTQIHTTKERKKEGDGVRKEEGEWKEVCFLMLCHQQQHS